MANLELEGATVAALEALGLGQLDSLETCDAVIGGDVMDLLDTTELPDAKVRGCNCGCGCGCWLVDGWMGSGPAGRPA